MTGCPVYPFRDFLAGSRRGMTAAWSRARGRILGLELGERIAPADFADVTIAVGEVFA